MTIMEFLRGIWRAATRRDHFSREAYYAEKEAISRGVAARFTRGNVAVQMGRFLTAADLERERAELKRFQRASPIGR